MIIFLYYRKLLKTLLVSSLERRKERYAIIYTWRMLEGQVPNIEIQDEISKRGRKCTVSLDKCPSTIPNEAHIPGYTANWRLESNSICHMITSALRESRTVLINSSLMEAARSTGRP